MITEMIHTTSLIHDDLLDSADFRRGKEATYRTFGHREVSTEYLLYSLARV